MVTAKVVEQHFSPAITGGVLRSKPIKTKKASRKWLAFNDFYSGGRIRTSDLRVMSPTSYQAALPRDLVRVDSRLMPAPVKESRVSATAIGELCRRARQRAGWRDFFA